MQTSDTSGKFAKAVNITNPAAEKQDDLLGQLRGSLFGVQTMRKRTSAKILVVWVPESFSEIIGAKSKKLETHLEEAARALALNLIENVLIFANADKGITIKIS